MSSRARHSTGSSPVVIIVNTSRGELIDEVALAEAIDRGRVGAAALDVAEIEPLPAHSPLRECRNLIVTPHIAFYSEQLLAELQRKAVEDVLLVLEGREPLRRLA